MLNHRMQSLMNGAILIAMAATGFALEYPRLSPKATVSQVVGLTTIGINYGRPTVRGRVIWGALVPYDEVWRTGADEASTILFSDPVTINDVSLPAGEYALFTIPGKSEWTIILSRNPKQYGAFKYNQAEDALRIAVKPQKAEFHERMTFSFPAVTLDSVDIELCWEKVKVAFTVKTDTLGRLLPLARAQVAEAKPDDFRTPLGAATFCLDNNVYLTEAEAWIEKSLAVKDTLGGQVARARLLAARGKKTEAIAMAKDAIATAKSINPKVKTAWIENYIAEWGK
jgi:hypothetical protein